MNKDQFKSPIERHKRNADFWQGVACGLIVAMALLLVAVVRMM
ncbi:MAG: hypothetical protein ACLGH6_09015 [Gammaproteobacteria bacterium]